MYIFFPPFHSSRFSLFFFQSTVSPPTFSYLMGKYAFLLLLLLLNSSSLVDWNEFWIKYIAEIKSKKKKDTHSNKKRNLYSLCCSSNSSSWRSKAKDWIYNILYICCCLAFRVVALDYWHLWHESSLGASSRLRVHSLHSEHHITENLLFFFRLFLLLLYPSSLYLEKISFLQHYTWLTYNTIIYQDVLRLILPI